MDTFPILEIAFLCLNIWPAANGPQTLTLVNTTDGQIWNSLQMSADSNSEHEAISSMHVNASWPNRKVWQSNHLPGMLSHSGSWDLTKPS